MANILSQFRMIIHSKSRVYFDTDKYYKSGNIRDLGFDIVTPQGFQCKFVPTPEGLHIYHIDKNCKGKIFGDTVMNDQMIYVGSSHAILHEVDEIVEVLGVQATDSGDSLGGARDDETTGVRVNDEALQKGVCFTDDVVTAHEEDVIDTVARSRDKFSKRDQLRVDLVQHPQHVAAFPSDAMLIYSFTTNGIKNNPLTTRDVEICNEMLGHSKYIYQGKITAKSP